MKYLTGNRIYVICCFALLGLLIGCRDVNAQVLNPCQYVEFNKSMFDKIDTGNDENFKRIMQQKNQEMVRACVDYETKSLENARNNINRDNY